MDRRDEAHSAKNYVFIVSRFWVGISHQSRHDWSHEGKGNQAHPELNQEKQDEKQEGAEDQEPIQEREKDHRGC
jgi:hypothetical protein